MARKMADEILQAERQGEGIISDAEIKANEIVENAKAKAKSDSVNKQAEALKKADSIIKQAKAGTENEKQTAEATADKIRSELNQSFEKNRRNALETAVSILIS